MKERCIGEGALCAKERGGSGGDGTAVRGEGEWLACLVLMWVLVNGICCLLWGTRRIGAGCEA